MNKSYVTRKRYGIVIMRLSLFGVILLYSLSSIPGFSVVRKSFAHELTRHKMSPTALSLHRHNHTQSAHPLFHTRTAIAPDAQMSIAVVGDSTPKAGDTVIYNLDVATSINDGEVSGQTPLVVTAGIPAGFNNLAVSSTDWNLKLDNTISPATMTATYTGATPIAPGTMLPSIILTGTLTDQVAESLTTTATLSLQGDSNSANDTASAVIEANSSSTPTPTPEPTPIMTPEPTPITTPQPPTPTPQPPVTPGPNLTVTLGDNTTGCTNIGDQIIYTATVTNAGDADVVATGQPITVTMTLPDGLSDVTPTGGTDWQTSINGTVVLASYSGSYPVAAGTSLAPITMTATMQTPANMSPVSSATVTTPQATNTSNDIGSDTLTICTPNLAISTNHQETDAFQVGQSVIYTLGVSDGMAAGPVIAGQPITVTDAVPLSISEVTPTGNGWQFTSSTSPTATMITATYTGDYPILTGDSLPDITISGNLTDAAAPTVINSAMVSTPLDSDTSDNVSSDTLTVAPAPDLLLGLKHAGTTCIPAKQDVIWTLSITNAASAGSVLNGPITLTDALPIGLSNIRVNSNAWSITHSGKVVTAIYAGSYPIDPGTMLPPVVVKGNIIAAEGTTLLNSAAVSTPGDSNTSNNTMSDTVAICPPPVIAADLGVHLTHAKTKCTNIGDPVTYKVLITNGKGGSVVAGQPITVTVTLASGLSNITPGGGTNWQVTTNGNTVMAIYSGNYPVKPVSTLDPILINATMQMPSSSSLVSYATVKTLRDSNLANNSAQDVLAICPPGLVISKIYRVSGPAHIGQSIAYTIIVTNKSIAGPVIAGEAIKVTIKFLQGLKQINAKGADWRFTTTSTPAMVVATYSSLSPVLAGVHLPNIMLSGIMTTSAPPIVTISVAVKTSPGGSDEKKKPYKHFSFSTHGVSGQDFVLPRRSES